MNVYDAAHELERAIRESEEFKQFDSVQKRVAENADLKAMIDDFHQKQMALQAKQMMGENIDDDMMQSIQNLYGIVMQNPLASEFMQCEMRFGIMMQDVYKILGEVVKIGD